VHVGGRTLDLQERSVERREPGRGGHLVSPLLVRKTVN
jgi:hypothetical protein